MSAFDLNKFNNINNMLMFKINNPVKFDYESDKNMFYTTWCLAQYYQDSEQPRLYGPDFVVVTYVHWYNEERNKQNESPIVVLGHEYDKDVRESWFDAASYHKYDYEKDCDEWDDERW